MGSLIALGDADGKGHDRPRRFREQHGRSSI
jgi:hypothetical protein